jgi:hypothetical protein
VSSERDIDWRARAEALEAELAERSALTNEALAEAQRRTYWLDRLHLDLNALMARGAARRMVALLPLARELYRAGWHSRETVRRLRDWSRVTRSEAAADAVRAERLGEPGEDLATAAERLLPAGARRVLALGPPDAAAALRERWTGLESGATAGEFDLLVVDDEAGGLGAAAGSLARDGRVLLVTTASAEAVLDRSSPGWAVLGRRRLAGGRDLYLLRRA